MKDTFAFKAGNSWTRHWISQEAPPYYINRGERPIATEEWTKAKAELTIGLKFAELRAKRSVFVMICKYYLGVCATNQRVDKGKKFFEEALAEYDRLWDDVKALPKFKSMAEDIRKRLGRASKEVVTHH